MAKAPAENHFYNSLRLNDGGLGMTTPDVAYWPILLKKSVNNLRLISPAIRRPSIARR